MKRDLIVAFLISFIVLVFWRNAFLNFFAQDDFIFIDHFSRNSLLVDIKNTFGEPTVTHWRPLHNFYFLIAGNLFGKNFWAYHLLTLSIHIGTSFLIFKIAQKIFGDKRLAFLSGFIYGIHPAHFVSIFWIAGNATLIGMFFLIASFYFYLAGKKLPSLVSFFLAILASEAMIAGIGVYLVWDFVSGRKIKNILFYLLLSLVMGFVLFTKFVVFSPKEIFNIYQPELSIRVLEAVRYYLLRIVGFAETSGDLLSSVLLSGWLGLVLLVFVRLDFRQKIKSVFWPAILLLFGLFPFILIPSHLSPHYMNISVWAYAMIVSMALVKMKKLSLLLVFVFVIIATINVSLTSGNNWVIKRSTIARSHLDKIAVDRPDFGSTIVVDDSSISTSHEAYIALGGGRAVDFWFDDQNYQTCFTAFSDCPKN